jgi:hypothetical protein
MDRLRDHFLRVYTLLVSARSVQRLAHKVKGMTRVDSEYRFFVTGFDVASRSPRAVDVTLRELRRALKVRRRGVA